MSEPSVTTDRYNIFLGQVHSLVSIYIAGLQLATLLRKAFFKSFLDLCLSSTFRMIWRWNLSFEVVAGDESNANAKGDKTGEEPGTEVERNGGKGRWEDEANRIETDGKSETNHGNNQTGAEHTRAAMALLTEAMRMNTRMDHRHTFAMLQIANEYNKAKEDSQNQ